MKKTSPLSNEDKGASQEQLPLTRTNYFLILGGIAIIVLGLFILAIDDFVDAQQFSVSLYIAPLVILGGFVEIIFAIMYRQKKT